MDLHEIVEELNKRGKHIWNLTPKIRKYLSTNDKVKDIDLSEWEIEDLVELCQSINIDPFDLASNKNPGEFPIVVEASSVAASISPDLSLFD